MSIPARTALKTATIYRPVTPDHTLSGDHVLYDGASWNFPNGTAQVGGGERSDAMPSRQGAAFR